MFSLLLAVIYLAFISLGLPDSLIGSAWPVMHGELGAELSWAGILTMIVSCGTIVSSLLSDSLTKKFGAGLVTAASVALTAAALLGYSLSTRFYMLCLWAIPYGLGAGAIDAALNNYVALHFKPRHMSWLHCFWGVGALISPYIMGYALTGNLGWQSGFRIVFYIQIALSAVLFLSLPLWKKVSAVDKKGVSADVGAKPVGVVGALKIKGVVPILIAFLCYCAAEQTAGLWASSYMVQYRGISAEKAATYASLFYIGITAGRAATGFVTEKLGDKLLIRIGIAVLTLGLILIGIPVNNPDFAVAGLVIFGLGCAPIYPSIIHSTPYNFGRENSQAIIGIQMAGAYVGSTFMPPLFGVIAQYVNIGLYPVYMLFFVIVMLAMLETVNKIIKNKKSDDDINPSLTA